MREPTEGEMAAFEVGIKLGALYHQFVGTPVTVETAGGLERAIEEAVGLQPHVVHIEVKISREEIRRRINAFGYCELSGDMLEAEVEVEYAGIRARAILKYDEEMMYPEMKLMGMEN